MEKIIAGIVTYNPDIEILKKNISALVKQVDEICIVDNASKNIEEIKKLDGVGRIIANDENKGIAAGLNQALKYAGENTYKWILTMDQDSEIRSNMVSEYSNYINFEKIGMITCCISDDEWLHSNKEPFEYLTKCITSGCLTNVDAMQAVGNFDERFFIDYVDFDANVSLIKAGYKILRVNKVLINHKVGKAEPLKVFGKEVHIAGNKVEIYHEPVIRTYYFFRNLVFFMRKHGDASRGYTSKLHIVWRAMLVMLYEKPKREKVKAIFQGISDGMSMMV